MDAVAVEAVLTEAVGKAIGAEESGREFVVGTAGAERLGVEESGGFGVDRCCSVGVVILF